MCSLRTLGFVFIFVCVAGNIEGIFRKGKSRPGSLGLQRKSRSAGSGSGIGVQSLDSEDGTIADFNLDLPRKTNHTLELLLDLFGGVNAKFNHYIRPARRTTVNISWALERIIDIDEIHQIITLSLNEKWYWINEETKWDPADYGNVEIMRMPVERIWTPEIVLWNNADDKSVKLLPEALAILNYQGHVTWIRPEIYKVICRMNIRNFPFDKHVCNFSVGSWFYDDSEVHVQPREFAPPADFSQYQINSKWLLTNFTAHASHAHYHEGADGNRAKFSIVIFSVMVQRQWLFPFLFLIFPNVLMTAICIGSYVLPCESNEKAGLITSVFVSFLTYLLLLYDSLPYTEEVPVVTIFMLFVIFQTAMSLVVSGLDLYIHHSGKLNSSDRLPKFARRMCLHWLGKLFGFQQVIVPENIHEAKLGAYINPFVVWPYDVDEPSTDNYNQSSNIESRAESRNNSNANAEGSGKTATDNDRNEKGLTIVKRECYVGMSAAKRRATGSGGENLVHFAEGATGETRLPNTEGRRGTIGSRASRVSFYDVSALTQERFIKSVWEQGPNFGIVGEIPEGVKVEKRSVLQSEVKHHLEVLYHKIFKIMESYGLQLVTGARTGALVTEWKQASMVLDRIFLITNLVATLSFCVYFIVVLVQEKPTEYIH